MNFFYFMCKMILHNVNFRAKLLSPIDIFEFREIPPQMTVHSCKCIEKPALPVMKIIIFKNSKCRLMGCKSFTDFQLNQVYNLHLVDMESDTDITIQIIDIMSGSMTLSMDMRINLFKFSHYLTQNQIKHIFEPELFPALRITDFNPMCVNIFGSGKCVILGIRGTSASLGLTLSEKIINLINSSESLYSE